MNNLDQKQKFEGKPTDYFSKIWILRNNHKKTEKSSQNKEIDRRQISKTGQESEILQKQLTAKTGFQIIIRIWIKKFETISAWKYRNFKEQQASNQFYWFL